METYSTQGKEKPTRAHFLTIVCMLAVFTFFVNCRSNHNGYEGDLVPIKAETDKIAGYQQIVELIIKNNNRIKDEIKHPEKYEDKDYSDFKSFKHRKYSIIDSLKQLSDTLKLRFTTVVEDGLQIEGKDTTITFSSSAGDYYMRSNKKDSDACWTLFKHYIIYSTKAMEVFKIENDDDDTPNAVYKIKDRYYYCISSRLEY
ncbi:MAG: hypothetical protein EOO96_22105 [Pedobacter sp.]|nr:MAG: hypothetical protein EOO96_22105 [Pedobacter sp.]